MRVLVGALDSPPVWHWGALGPWQPMLHGFPILSWQFWGPLDLPPWGWELCPPSHLGTSSPQSCGTEHRPGRGTWATPWPCWASWH